MITVDSIYPESPSLNSKQLTALPFSYKFKAFLAVLAILLFFVLYTGLVTAFGFLTYYAVIYDMGSVNKLTVLLKIGAIAGAAMLFVFTLKFIFKIKNHKPVNRIKLSKEAQPNLWNFTHKICEETGAPKPKNIYVDPDVNAYVSYTNIWLSLFFPVKKELTIGLGLVGCLNLTEFKAVISHEFGHFAQRTMKIGSFINSANTIIYDMIYSRDKWDDTLDQWRSADIRVSAAAWAITPIIWVVRQFLALFYQFLNIMYSLLSQEMEFNADKVAVSTSGSTAIVSALWKLDNGFEKWNSTLNNSYLASKKNLFPKNLYSHNQIALDLSAEVQNQLLIELPIDKRGGKLFFNESEVSKANMYASHPPNDKREGNAKVPFIDSIEDERSPWILFANKEQVQEEMTSLVFLNYLGKEIKDFCTDPEFQNFISKEGNEKELIDEYQNTFEHRYLIIPENLELEAKADEVLSTSVKALEKIKEELTELMKPVKELEGLMLKAQQISEGSIAEKTLNFKGKTFKRKKLGEAYNEIAIEREKHFENDFKEWDAQFCAYHLAIAKKEGKQEELLRLYSQHRTISQLYRFFVQTKNTIYNEVNQLQGKGDFTETDVTNLALRVRKLFVMCNDEMQILDRINYVPMPNIETVEELKHAIVDEGEFKSKQGKIFENGGFDEIVNTLESAGVHCQRIDQKSVGMILEFHKSLTNNKKEVLKG